MRILSDILSFFGDILSMIWEMFVHGPWYVKAIMGSIAAFVLWMGIEGTAMFANSWEYYGPGTIMDMVYEPSRTTTTFVSDGNGGSRMQTITTPEQFVLVVSVKNDAESIRVTSKRYAATKEGDEVAVYRRYGLFLHMQRIGETQ